MPLFNFMSKNIKNLILTNFQQWKKGNIQFTKGLNVLVGDTECGKSTLFRAISSILTGKMPEDYIRKGCKDVEVKINFDNDTYFRRFRSKKDNIADANGTIFERVGKDIPFEYFKSLGNTNISFGSKDLSLCLYSQFDSHFFITLSDYDKSKLIGTICGIDIIDKLVDSINKDIRSNNTNIKFLTNKIAEKTQERENKSILFSSIDKKYQNLENKLNSVENAYKMLENLSNLSNKKVLLDKDINTLNLKITQNKAIINNFTVINIETKAKMLEKLVSLFNGLQKINSDLFSFQNKIKHISRPAPTETLQLLEKLNNISKKLIVYEENIIKNNHIFMSNNLKLQDLQKEQKELLKGYKNCPLCGGIINE